LTESKELTVLEQTEPKADEREDKFIRYFLATRNIKRSALKAGYSPDYSKSGVYLKFKSKDFQNKIKEYLDAEDYKDLTIFNYLDRVALKGAMDDIQSSGDDIIKGAKAVQYLAKLKDTRITKNRTTKRVSDDNRPGSLTVNVKYLQNMMLNAHK
jgi:phage terminase small subunit